MDLFKAIENRRSIRKYTQKSVDKEKTLKIFEIARLSPSAMNLQPYGFVIISKSNLIKEISSACNQEWEAPIIVAVCALPGQAWVRDDGEEYWKADAAIAMSNIYLAAYNLCLGTCWIVAFNEEKVKKILGVDSKARVVAMTPLGYPAENKGPVTKRKTLDELLHYNKW